MNTKHKVILGVIVIFVVVAYIVKSKKAKTTSETVSYTGNDYKDLKPFNRTIPMQVENKSNLGQLTVGE